MKIVDEKFKPQAVKFEIDATILNEVISEEKPRVLLNHLLAKTDLLERVKEINPAFMISGLEDGIVGYDYFPSIYINLSEYYNIDKKYSYINLNEILKSEIEKISPNFLNLYFNFVGSDHIYFDEFMAKFDFNNLNKSINNIIYDLNKVNDVLKSFEIELPRDLSLKKK